MKTKTRAGLAPALALRRFAAVAAVLLAFCLVFMMPAGAVDGESSVTEVSTWNDLKSALEAGGHVKLGDEISLSITSKDDYLSVNKDTILDLAGEKIKVTYSGTESYGLIKVEGGTFTLTDSVGNGELTLTPSEPYNPQNVAVTLIKVYENAKAIIDASSTTKLSIAEELEQSGVYALEVYSMSGSPTLIIKEGIISSSYTGVRANLNSDTYTANIEMTGGKITGEKRGIWIQQTNTASNQYNLKISDGEITCPNGHPLYFTLMNEGGKDISTTTEISGGILTGKSGTSKSSMDYEGTLWIGEYVYPGLIMYTRGTDVNEISAENHVLKITGTPTICNTNNGDIIGVSYTHQWKGCYDGSVYYEYSDPEYEFQYFTDSPTVIVDITVVPSSEIISSTDFKGMFSVPAIGKSYEWSVGEWLVDEKVVTTTTENTYTHIFEPVDVVMPYEKKVSVKVILSDKYSITTEPITVTVPAKFGITYNSGEGSGTMNDDFAYSDDNVIVLPECTFTAPENSVFKAWKIDSQEYVAGTEVTITKDTTVTAVWNKNGKPVTVTPEISVVITVDKDSQTTISIPTADAGVAATTVVFSKEENKATVTDTSTGVQMVVNFDKDAEKTEGVVSGTVTSVEVKYPEAPAESEGDIKQEVKFVMGTAAEQPPEITSEKKQDVVDKVKKQEQRANVLAMITATRDKLDDLNKNISSVTITFRVHASLISNPNNLQGYHVDDKTGVNPVGISIDKEGEYYKITLTTTEYGFSSYVLVEEPQKSSGSATDTGSGNYQYYPRSVPTDGIISFGTSKVVTGMELPAGSDGTVTLNIRPAFTMPENGYYAFEIDAPGYNLDAKINGGLSFQIPVSELEAAGFTAEDIVLFHGTAGEDGKITWEALPTNLVKNENGIAYYKAAINGCSPFYIGFVKDGAIINTEVLDPVTPETPVTPDEPEVLPPADEPQDEPTEEPATPAPVLAVLAGLGAVIALRRK